MRRILPTILSIPLCVLTSANATAEDFTIQCTVEVVAVILRSTTAKDEAAKEGRLQMRHEEDKGRLDTFSVFEKENSCTAYQFNGNHHYISEAFCQETKISLSKTASTYPHLVQWRIEIDRSNGSYFKEMNIGMNDSYDVFERGSCQKVDFRPIEKKF